MLETPRPSTPMSISFAHNDDSRASVASVHVPQSGQPTAGWKRDAGGDENVQPGGGQDSDRDHEVGTAATADPVEQKKVQELEDAIRKRYVARSITRSFADVHRRSIIPSLTSELAQLEEQIKAAEERTERLARAAALAKV